jgi:hypothetical protein
MTSLFHLSVSSNTGLTGEIPELLHNKYFIEKLELHHGNTSLVPPTTFRWCRDGLDLYLPYLVRTRGSGNTFSVDCTGGSMGGTIPEWIGAVTGLTSLQIPGNDMVGTLPTGLWRLTNMRSL